MAARRERKMTMPVYNRGDRWHYAFGIPGVRYREAMPVDSRYEFLLVLTFLGVAFLLFPDMVVACARAPKPTVLQAYNDSEVVAIARAISVEKLSDESQKPMIGTLVTSTRMEVEKVYKGNLRVGDKMVFGQGNGTHCTWVFDESDIGKQYLFYLNSPSKDQKLWYEYGLGRSNLRENAADDLLYLNKMDKVRGRTRISGVLSEDGLAGLSVEGQTIRIIGRNKTYVTKTDKNGVYELYDVPPGRYVLAPELKFGWQVGEFSLARPLTRLELMHGRRQSNRVAFTLRPRNHFGVDLRLKLSNHVSGTIYDSNSKPMRWVCVSLVPANDESFLGCNSLTDELGRFQIDAVEAGSYIIIFNYENKITSRMPFPKLYYPGVPEREKARTITLKHGESASNLNVVIRK
jgi:hypothetical protein